MRLDIYVSLKVWVSRNRAQFFIKQEKVKVNWKIIKKASFEIENDALENENISKNITINLENINYVSRSALKLKWFIENNNIKVDNFVCVDIWASTWWFSQILLEKNVEKIYAIDVWTSQLHNLLKNNEKIISIENTDIRKFDKSIIKESLDLIVCDVSFISLYLIIDSILALKSDKTKIILLFKPQFEVWNEYINKIWVVTNEKIIKTKFSNFCLLLKNKWVIINKIEESSLLWENWNKEIFIFLS